MIAPADVEMQHLQLKWIVTAIQDLTPLVVAEEKGFANFEVKDLAVDVVAVITAAVPAYSAQK